MVKPKQLRLTSLWLIAPFLLLVPSVAWILRDNGSWMWDQSWYAECSVRLYALLKSHGKDWLNGMLSIDGCRASGLIWFGQFFVGLHQVFGSIERSLLFYLLFLQAVTVWIVYDTCSRLADGRKLIGAACASFVAAAPLFVGIGHEYFVENLQLLVVAWLWRLAVISPEVSRRDLVIMTAMVLTLGMAAKVTTPLFAGPPLVLAGLGASGVLLPRSATPRAFKPLTRVILLTALALIAGLTCAWYIQNFKYLLAHMIVASGKGAIFWGSADPFPTKFLRWLGFLRISFLPGFMLYAALAVVAIGLFRTRWTSRPERRLDSVALGGLVSVILTLTVYSIAVNEDYRLSLPLLPAIVVILAWALHKVPRPLGLIFCLVTMGGGVAVQLTALAIIPPPLDYTGWMRPVNTDLREELRLPDGNALRILSHELSALVRLTGTPETDNRPQLCAVQYFWLNCNLLRFYASKEKVLNGGFMPSFAPNGLGYGESDLDKALQNIDTIKPKFIISVREDLQPPPNFVNLVNLPLLAHLRTDPRYEQVEFPSTLGIIVFKRIGDFADGDEGKLWGAIQRPSGYSLLNAMPIARKAVSTPGYCQIDIFNIEGEKRKVLFQHPVADPGLNRVSFENPPIRPGSKLKFGIAMHPDSWDPAKGDGVEFSIEIYYDNGQKKLFNQYIEPKNNPKDRGWHDFEMSLNEFAGKKVRIILQTKPGPRGDHTCDWAGWSGLEIVAEDTPSSDSVSFGMER